MPFPKDFLFGAAAASYQLEGAALEDGRGPCIWHRFSQTPGKTYLGQTGEIASDHYHRYVEDVGLMSELGLQAYRFSVSWPRVLPEGTGSVNERGLSFYDKLTDQLLEAGIEPWLTLFHWDYPYALYQRGGWLNPDSPKWFADYTAVLVERLSDRIQNWITFNELNVVVMCGHRIGLHAPGLKLPLADCIQLHHHILLSHGKAVQVIRQQSKRETNIGVATVGHFKFPASQREEDIEAARKACFSCNRDTIWDTTWSIDPIYLGAYPTDGLEHLGEDAPTVGPDDLSLIGQPLDFLGINHYFGSRVRANPTTGEPEILEQSRNQELSALYWPVTPDSIYWVCRWLHERYQQPIVIAENGLSSHDYVSADDAVHDTGRINFLARHLRSIERAIEDGAQVTGYFHWSVMDNFEWHEGYRVRFGLIHVDYDTLKRRIKDSGRWYARLIHSRGATLHST